jgi:hypothetical protein
MIDIRPLFDYKIDIHNFCEDGGVAQGLEQWNHNPCVGGSIPPLATIIKSSIIP